MAQDWMDDCFGETHDGITDLENMEKNFTALKSLFSGASEPTFTKVSGMPWYDTGQKILKIRNSVNNDWVGVMTGNESFKIWVYLNAITAQEGWGLDGSAADMVIGLKGSTRYTTGAVAAGSWKLPDYNVVSNHTHPMQSHTHILANTGSPWNDAHDGTKTLKDSGGGLRASGTGAGTLSYQLSATTGGPSASNTGDGGTHTPTHTDNGTWGLRAAVGIMVYPDINP